MTSNFRPGQKKCFVSAEGIWPLKGISQVRVTLFWLGKYRGWSWAEVDSRLGLGLSNTSGTDMPLPPAQSLPRMKLIPLKGNAKCGDPSSTPWTMTLDWQNDSSENGKITSLMTDWEAPCLSVFSPVADLLDSQSVKLLPFRMKGFNQSHPFWLWGGLLFML